MKRLALILVLLAAASADTVTFTDRGSWSGGVGAVTNTSFNPLVTPGGTGFRFLGSTPPAIVVDDASYMATSILSAGGTTESNSYVYLLDPSFAGGAFSPGGYATLMASSEYSYGDGTSYSGGLNVGFGTARTAVGFNLDTYFSSAIYTIVLSNGERFCFYAGPNSSVFFGFISETALTSVYITAYSESGGFGIGEVSYNYDPSTAPEPATLLLVGTGMIVGLRRLRHRF